MNPELFMPLLGGQSEPQMIMPLWLYFAGPIFVGGGLGAGVNDLLTRKLGPECQKTKNLMVIVGIAAMGILEIGMTLSR